MGVGCAAGSGAFSTARCSACSVSGEAYEGMLVTIADATMTALANSYGEIAIDDVERVTAPEIVEVIRVARGLDCAEPAR